jgi:glucan 1,6-alpha-glucosidase
MQWSDGPNAGFTTGIPWLPVNENYRQIHAAAAVEDPNSVFCYYQKLIRLRKQYDVFCTGSFTLLSPEDSQVFAYTRDTDRGHLLVVCNFTGERISFEVPDRFCGARLLLSNYREDASGLRPYEAAMLYYTDEKPGQ